MEIGCVASQPRSCQSGVMAVEVAHLGNILLLFRRYFRGARTARYLANFNGVPAARRNWRMQSFDGYSSDGATCEHCQCEQHSSIHNVVLCAVFEVPFKN